MENQMEEKKEQKSRGPGKGALGFLFLMDLFIMILAAAGFLFLWVWVSYRMRYSAEVIRVGLIFVYILPCMLGGRLLFICRHSYLPFWGALMGGLFYGLLCLCTLLVKGGDFSFETIEWTTPVLCVLSGMVGAIRSDVSQNRQKGRKSVRNE